jgi:hypothetical protein
MHPDLHLRLLRQYGWCWDLCTITKILLQKINVTAQPFLQINLSSIKTSNASKFGLQSAHLFQLHSIMHFTSTLFLGSLVVAGLFSSQADACITAKAALDGRTSPSSSASRTSNVYKSGQCINGKYLLQGKFKVC